MPVSILARKIQGILTVGGLDSRPYIIIIHLVISASNVLIKVKEMKAHNNPEQDRLNGKTTEKTTTRPTD